MCKLFHNRRFDRAVTSEIKEARYIPDDPYKVNKAQISVLHNADFEEEKDIFNVSLVAI